MPNWCQNVMYVSHTDKEMMVALKDAIIKRELCDHIKPMPEELEDTTSSDYPNWYDWRVNNWGTKWDIYSPWDTDEIYVADDGKETYVFKFDTAWSPPIPIYDAMMDQGFNLVARYVEYGCGYHGEYGVDGDFYHDSIEDGDEIDEHLQSEYA